MKTFRSVAWIVCAAAVVFANAVPAQILTGLLPLPRPPEAVPPPPGPGYAWMDGEWVWDGRWVWVSGHWAIPPYPNAAWMPGSWLAVPRGYVRVPGHWQ